MLKLSLSTVNYANLFLYRSVGALTADKDGLDLYNNFHSVEDLAASDLCFFRYKIMHKAPTAHTQNSGQPNSDFCGIGTVNAKMVPPISANPINSSILPMRIVLSHILKSYIFFKLSTVMGKYSMVMLAFLIAGMIIAATSKPFNTPMFYSMLAGAVIVIGYTTWHNRKEHQRIKREKRKSRK